MDRGVQSTGFFSVHDHWIVDCNLLEEDWIVRRITRLAFFIIFSSLLSFFLLLLGFALVWGGSVILPIVIFLQILS